MNTSPEQTFNKLQHSDQATAHQNVVAALFTTFWRAAAWPVCKALDAT